jgi:hypothetical protein
MTKAGNCATLMDYAVPRADMLPRYELDRTVTTSPLNPMGVKGVGEAGTIDSTPLHRQRGNGCAGSARHPPYRYAVIS